MAASLNQASGNVANTMQGVQKIEAEKQVVLGQLKARYDAGLLKPEDYQAALQGNMNKARAAITQADAGWLLKRQQQEEQLAAQRFALEQANSNFQHDATNRTMNLRENQLKADVEKMNNLGRVNQVRLSDGTVADVNLGTGQIVGGVKRNNPAPNGEEYKFIQDPATGKTIGYRAWNGSTYGEPHNVPAPNPMEALMGLGAGAGAQPPMQVPSTAKVTLAPAGPPRINSQAEYDALPSGSQYIDAQTGKTGRKP